MTSPYTSRKHSSYAKEAYLLPTPKPSKPPIHNPYDKFTQPEFESWIGGITDALKRALGQEAEIEQESTVHESYFTPASGGIGADLPDDSESQDEVVDDSFADIKARRALGKGKARDPREGPGFGIGDMDHPIEIDLNSEEEEESEGSEVEEGEEEEQESEVWDEEEESSEEEERVWATGESSAQGRIRRNRRDAESVEEEESDQEYSEAGEVEQGVGEEDTLLLSGEDEENSVEYDEDEPERNETPSGTRGIRSSRGEVVNDEEVYELDPEVQETEYISDSDDVEQDDNIEGNITQSTGHNSDDDVPPPSFEVLDNEEGLPVEDLDHKFDFYNHRVAERRSTSMDFRNELVEASTSSPNTRGTLPTFESTPHKLQETLGLKLKATPPLDPCDIEKDASAGDNVDIETEAEEDKKVYSPVPFFSSAEPVYHAAENERPLVYDVDVDEENGELETTVIQPITEDTSFPPYEASSISMNIEVPVEIRDVWHGPKTYAEDFYSGGDAHLKPEIGAHYLGTDDQQVNTSTPKPADMESEYGDVIMVDSPEHSPSANSNQLPGSLGEEIEQIEGEVVQEVDEVTTSFLHSPNQDITGSQEGQFTQGLSFDDLYDIDMTSFDEGTLKTEQTAGSWGFSDTPGEGMIPTFDSSPSFQESTTKTTVGTNIKPIELFKDRHINDQRTLPEKPVSSQPAKGEKSEVRELPITGELVKASGVPITNEPDNVQELAKVVPSQEECGTTPQTADSQVPAVVIEPAANQSVVETRTQGDELQEIHEHLQLQDTEPDVEIVVISDLGREVLEDNQDASYVLLDEPPSISVQPPSPIPPTTPTAEQQQSFEFQAEDLSTRSKPSQLTNDHGSEKFFPPAIKAKYEFTNITHPNMDNGLPTPPSELTFETTNINSLSENIEHPSLSTSDSTPEYEIIISEGADGETDLIVQETVLNSKTYESIEVDKSDSEAPENPHSNTARSVVLANLVDFHIDRPLLSAPLNPSSPQEIPLASPPSPAPVEFTSRDPSSTDNSDVMRREERMSRQNTQPPYIAPTRFSALGGTHTPTCPDTPTPDPTPRAGTPTTEPPRIKDSPTATVSSSFEPSSLLASPPALHSMQVMMRKPSHPVLLSDPYPYSLSTPDYPSNMTNHETYEPEEEETTEQENSMSSSSTFDKDVEEKEKYVEEGNMGNGVEPDFFEMDLRYPSDNDNSPAIPAIPAIPTNSPPRITPEAPEFYHNDTDADGDIDPDFGEIHEPVTMSNIQPPVISTHSKDDPFLVPGPTSPDIRENGEKHTVDLRTSSGSSATKPIANSTTNGSGLTTFGTSVDGLPSILIVKPKPPRMQIPHDEDLEELTELEDSPPRAPKPSRPPKRKLSASFLQGFSPITRSMATKTPELSGSSLVKSAMKRISSKPNKPASKGKRKELNSRQDSEQPSESSKSSGSTSKIPRRDTNASRESSIASSAPSDKSSTAHQPSPTVNKPITSRPPAPPPPPPPLMHTHSHAFRHVHHHPSAPQQPRVQTQVRKASSLGSPAGESSTAKPTPPPQQPTRGASFFASSPVTRSNCRYHKISIPKEEDEPDGPRVYFIIPGCSLGDQKLIREEFILDHGDATHEDSLRMVQDMEGWGVHPYIIGVLRVMAGVETTREQDFYYLPEPGEVRPEPKASPEKSTSAKHPSRNYHENGATHGSPRTPVISNPSPTSSKAPISTASNSTTSTRESMGGTKRGMKRSRTSDVYGGEEALDRGQKKLKARQTEWWRDD
ncbi:hypothetical protein BDZ94DRAFT_1299219 [Collybia nuda]|uniref:Uncharacterized protein n=1 Tax=Collybia nuda TaxID=64659 RepID=A0A9P5Y3C4_9AGAR|nr:hypothetical protein BDZ94DRAFT_1299219 [Collybia nuda]